MAGEPQRAGHVGARRSVRIGGAVAEPRDGCGEDRRVDVVQRVALGIEGREIEEGPSGTGPPRRRHGLDAGGTEVRFDAAPDPGIADYDQDPARPRHAGRGPQQSPR